jgi:PKD repeat protein
MNMKRLLFTLLLGVAMGTLMAQNAWINEIHYDNAGSDQGEFIEVVLENAGTYTLSDFEVYTYNGNGGGTYNSPHSLDQFTAGVTISGFTFYYYPYPSNGLQNGAPDGMALVYQGTVVPGQFLSYEGTFTASNGPASGMTSTDLGVAESSSTPIGQSLQLGGTGNSYASFTWETPQAETPGNVNANQTMSGAVDPEPTNYPTGLTANPQIFAMDVTWTDASGGQLPSAYLLLASDQDNITLPVDGTPVADDPDLSDGTAALNIAQGVGAASFGNLPGNQIYYFKIFPYTNGGPSIDYKTDGTPPATNATTPDVVIINEEDFNTATLGTWMEVSVIGSQTWGIENNYGVGGTPCAKMSGYQSGSNENEDWLISPAMNFNHYTGEMFQFQTAMNYSGPELEVYISNDYAGSGDPNLATWSQLSPTWSPGGWTWTPSGLLDISGTAGSGVYLGFKYTSTSSQSATWEVDEILVVGTPDFSGPTVVTDPNVTNITNNTATAGGDVTDDGGTAIVQRGICYGTTFDPDLSGMFTTEPGTLGAFTSDLTGLLPITTYYVRAYAINALDTAYGNSEMFTTDCDPGPPITDFHASVTTIMVGESIDFFDDTEYCPDEWNWSFVGGTPMSSTEQNPTGIVWDYPGIYNVCLTTTNQYGQDVLCKMGYITVNAPIEADLVITEIMYNPPESGTDSVEFIEIYNNDQAAVNLENFYFSQGVDFVFPNITLNPGEYILVSESADAMMNTFGVLAYQWTDGALNNGGESIVLNEPMGNVIDEVTYSDYLPWDSLADGYGPSLELCDPNTNNALPENWRAAIEFAAVNGAGDTIYATPLAGCSYPPEADFSASDTVLNVGEQVTFTDESTGQIDTWEWTFEGGDPASYEGQNPPPVTYNDMGSFDVTLVVGNIAGFSTMIALDYIEVGPSSIQDHPGSIAFRIYPNPVTNGSIQIVLPSKSQYEISITSSVGHLVVKKQVTDEKAQIATSMLKKGIYIVRVTDLATGLQGIQKLVVNN